MFFLLKRSFLKTMETLSLINLKYVWKSTRLNQISVSTIYIHFLYWEQWSPTISQLISIERLSSHFIIRYSCTCDSLPHCDSLFTLYRKKQWLPTRKRVISTILSAVVIPFTGFATKSTTFLCLIEIHSWTRCIFWVVSFGTIFFCLEYEAYIYTLLR